MWYEYIILNHEGTEFEKNSNIFRLYLRFLLSLNLPFCLGINFLAVFLTEIGRKYDMVDEFDAKSKENGVQMFDYFIHKLLKIIYMILAPL